MKKLILFALLGLLLLPKSQSAILGSGNSPTNVTYIINGGSSGTVTQVDTGTGLSGGPITTTGTITLLEATTSTIGGLKSKNCTGSDKFSGITNTGAFVCSSDVDTNSGGTVYSVDTGTGLTGGPFVDEGTISLLEALTSTIGGVKVANCTAGSYFDGYSVTNVPRCTLEVGDISNVGVSTGLSGGGSSGAVTLSLKEASASEIGGIKASNCTSTDKVTGITNTGSLLCGSDVDTNSGGDITDVNAGTGLTGGGVSGSVTLTLKEAGSSEIGGIKSSNCTSTDKVKGITNTGALLCAADTDTNSGGTVTSITQGTGLSFSASPLTTTGTINLAEALSATIGGVKVSNCTAGQYVDGWSVTNTPRCTAEVGDISGVTASTGLTGGGSSGAVSLSLLEGTSSVIGGVQVANCTSGNYFDGYTTTNVPRCTAEVGDISGVTASTGLSGGGSSGAVSLSLAEATTSTIGGIKVANCTAGQYITGWSATNTPTCSNAPTGTMILLSSQDTDLNRTVSGNCYNYTLPANTYSSIIVEAKGNYYGPANNAATWDAKIGMGTTKETTRIGQGALASMTHQAAIALSYSQAQTSTVKIDFNGTLITGGGSFVCQSMRVWGVI